MPGDRQDGSAEGDPERLAAVLAARGIVATVEAHGRLAVLTMRTTAGLPGPDLRAVLLADGRQAGFSSVAVELSSTDEPQA